MVGLPPSALPCPWRHTAHTLWPVQGLLLDLDAATLTVWVNGERKGVMVRPGMTDVDGEPVGRLEGPLRWVVALGPNAPGEIAAAVPPPARAGLTLQVSCRTHTCAHLP